MKYAQTLGYVHLTHFTPAHKPSWCWMFFAPIMSLLPGPQETIIGTVVNNPGSIGMSEGVSDLPKFQTRDAALAWCEENGVMPMSVEIE